MFKLITALLGFYIPFIIGYISRKKKFLSDESIKSLSKLILYFFFPILLYDSIYRKSIANITSDFFYMIFSSIFVISTSMIIAFILFKNERDLVLPSAYVNAAYLPIPIAYAIWGIDALSLIAFYVLANVCIGNIAAPIILGGSSIKTGIKRLSKFPPLYAIILGLLSALVNLKFPNEIASLISDIGRIAPYLALVILGAQVVDIKGSILNSNVRKVAVIRFAISPILMFSTQFLYTPPNELAFKIALLESCMPPAVTNVIYANEFSKNPERISEVVFTLTLISTLLIPIIIALLTL